MATKKAKSKPKHKPKSNKGKPRQVRLKDADSGADVEGMGQAQPVIPELTAALEDYIAVRDRRMGLTDKEVEAKDAALKLMAEHDLTHYVDHDAGVQADRTVEHEKLKAKRLKEEAGTE